MQRTHLYIDEVWSLYHRLLCDPPNKPVNLELAIDLHNNYIELPEL